MADRDVSGEIVHLVDRAYAAINGGGSWPHMVCEKVVEVVLADLSDDLAELAELRALVREVHRWVAESGEARNANRPNPAVWAIAPLESAERVVTIGVALLGQKYEHLAKPPRVASAAGEDLGNGGVAQ